MPAWARLLAATTTGAGVVIGGLVAAAAWREGGPGFWPGLWQYAASAVFWGQALRFWLLTLLAFALGRFASSALSETAAAVLSGAVVAIGFAAYLAGRLQLPLREAAPEAALIAICQAAGAAVAARVYEGL